MDAPRGEELAGLGGTDLQSLSTDTRAVDEGAAVGLLERGDPPFAYWATPDERILAGSGAVCDLTAAGPDRVAAVRGQAQRVLSSLEHDGPEAARPRLLGGMSFHPNLVADGVWDAFAPAWFFLPRTSVATTPDGTWATVTGDGSRGGDPTDGLTDPQERGLPDLPRVTAQDSEPTREEWVEQVRTIRERIDAEAFQKVVLAHTRSVELDDRPDPGALVRRLRETNPNCHVFLFQPDASTIFAGATPERLVSRRDTDIHTDALAGSMRRGCDDTDDNRLSAALQESRKDVHEHTLVVDAITDRLQSLGAEVTIGDRTVSRLRSVQHLHTPIQADHPEPPHVLRVVDELHPTPAVGGLPRAAALREIRATERFDRGWYAAPIGWFDERGDGEFAIGIRSAVFQERRARLFAGAGIVADSDPAAEWDELQLKYRPILDAFDER